MSVFKAVDLIRFVLCTWGHRSWTIRGRVHEERIALMRDGRFLGEAPSSVPPRRFTVDLKSEDMRFQKEFFTVDE